jgi:hypothetical protein
MVEATRILFAPQKRIIAPCLNRQSRYFSDMSELTLVEPL